MAYVYLETTILSYLAARPSRDLITAANQQLTHEWWERRRSDFSLCVSEAVLREARAGDPQVAAKRDELAAGLPLLVITEEAIALAEALVRQGPLPPKAATDAIHIAVAAVHAVEYLLTWNCKHIANAEMNPLVRAVCERLGHRMPVICTPAELMGE
ncbi:MAG TPA: type II toxin-antitoxin system VapC family toxin [Longimicrobiaceae bacterium]